VILSKLRLFPAPEQRRQTLATLRSVLGRTQVEPSCSAAQVYEEDGPEAAILYVEEWSSESEFRDHVRSDLYRRILAAIDLSRCAPEVSFYHVSKVQGLELVQEIRDPSGTLPAANPARPV
jgi:quinol monooxygenase YgiN